VGWFQLTTRSNAVSNLAVVGQELLCPRLDCPVHSSERSTRISSSLRPPRALREVDLDPSPQSQSTPRSASDCAVLGGKHLQLPAEDVDTELLQDAARREVRLH
jgi:hypothetical protein